MSATKLHTHKKQQARLYNLRSVIKQRMNSLEHTYDKVLPEDGAISAETFTTVLIIIHVFYCIYAFCWYIKDIIPLARLQSQLSVLRCSGNLQGQVAEGGHQVAEDRLHNQRLQGSYTELK